MVWHYHFLNWPAFANPAPNSLVSFRKRFREDLARFRNAGDDGPPLVHCCSGGLRSGAFVLIDENLSSAAASGRADLSRKRRGTHKVLGRIMRKASLRAAELNTCSLGGWPQLQPSLVAPENLA